MSNENKKKTIILTFIGVLTLLFVVIGGTFAYFQIVNVNEGSSNTNFNAQTDDLDRYGTPLLKNGSELYIYLSASDMAYGKRGTPYYATLKTESKDKTYEEEKQNHVVSTASIKRPEGDDVVEDTYLKCTSELTITIEGDMAEVLQYGDGKLYLGTKSSDGNRGIVSPNSFDLAELVELQKSGENKATVSYGITGYTSVDVTADIEIVNTDKNQTTLAGTNITITITNNNLSCSVNYSPNTIEILREVDPDNHLSTSLVGGMHRYQGLYTDEINNYICLGDNCCTTESCPASNDDDMYRIIGITDSGEMKVVKKTALAGYVKWWSSDNTTDIKWPESLPYQKLNGKSEGSTEPKLDDENSYYYSLDENLKNKIVNDHLWSYGDAYDDDSGGFDYNGDTIYGIESGRDEATYYQKEDSKDSPTGKGEWKDTIEAPIGLMYISDYYYAYKTNNGGSGNPENYNNAINSWIHLSHNQSTNTAIWTMSRYGFYPTIYYFGWLIYADGHVNYNNLNTSYALRPTFYLSSDVELSGGGSLTNPFTVKGVSS